MANIPDDQELLQQARAAQQLNSDNFTLALLQEGADRFENCTVCLLPTTRLNIAKERLVEFDKVDGRAYAVNAKEVAEGVYDWQKFRIRVRAVLRNNASPAGGVTDGTNQTVYVHLGHMIKKMSIELNNEKVQIHGSDYYGLEQHLQQVFSSSDANDTMFGQNPLLVYDDCTAVATTDPHDRIASSTKYRNALVAACDTTTATTKVFEFPLAHPAFFQSAGKVMKNIRIKMEVEFNEPAYFVQRLFAAGKTAATVPAGLKGMTFVINDVHLVANGPYQGQTLSTIENVTTSEKKFVDTLYLRREDFKLHWTRFNITPFKSLTSLTDVTLKVNSSKAPKCCLIWFAEKQKAASGDNAWGTAHSFFNPNITQTFKAEVKWGETSALIDIDYGTRKGCWENYQRYLRGHTTTCHGNCQISTN